jgi:hypothetical protein
MSGFLTGFAPTVSGALLDAGTYNGRIVSVKEVTDHMRNLSGASKEDYRFANVHDQIAVVVTDDANAGTAIHRFNTAGWLRLKDIAPANRKGLKADPATGYAVDKAGNRLEDVARTEKCKSIFNGFLNSLTLKDGTPLIKQIEGETDIAVIFAKMTNAQNPACLQFTVENREYNGKSRPEMTKWRKVSALVTVTAGEDQNEGDL